LGWRTLVPVHCEASEAPRQSIGLLAYFQSLLVPLELAVKREEYDAWFRAKVLEAMKDSRPTVSHDQVEKMFHAKRATAKKKPVRR